MPPGSSSSSVKSGNNEVDCANKKIEEMGEESKTCLPEFRSASKILNKKRSYAQYHLELGQSDFLLHSCTTCGLMYTQGDEEDEKVHKKFHRDYYQGIQFKGWRNERVVSSYVSGDRIILFLDSDPPAHKNKVQDVVRAMEKDLGFADGQLINKYCKVYLYISSHRVVGCLVSEPIKAAYRIILNTSPSNSSSNCAKSKISHKPQVSNKDPKTSSSTTLQFGNFSFHREVTKRNSASRNQKVHHFDSGAILCEDKAVPALCGIRAIWVVPSCRREGIACRLLDTARTSFSPDRTVELSELAFSAPTSAGKALASSYTANDLFLVYKTEVGI